MSQFSADDHRFMARAIQLAMNGLYTTSPNPRVGCVIVKDGEVVGEGFHLKAGEPHAEVHALRMAGEKAVGATAYVTLEPCSHYGRTPPCAEALTKARVARVVAAMVDPNPQVSGRGMRMLQDAGIKAESGLLQPQSEALNPGFIKRMSTGLSYVTMKSAQSLDGRTAMQSGESQWITGPHARQQVQRLRARSCAVVTGISSIEHDDSSLTVREDELGLDNAQQIAERQPLRVVLDSQLSISVSAKILKQPGRTLVVYVDDKQNRAGELLALGAELKQIPADKGRVDLGELLKYLAEEQQCNEVLVETGAVLAGAFLAAQLVDELAVFTAMTLMGSEARPLYELPMNKMSQQISLTLLENRMVGNDLCLRLKPNYQEKV